MAERKKAFQGCELEPVLVTKDQILHIVKVTFPHSIDQPQEGPALLVVKRLLVQLPL